MRRRRDKALGGRETGGGSQQGPAAAPCRARRPPPRRLKASDSTSQRSPWCRAGPCSTRAAASSVPVAGHRGRGEAERRRRRAHAARRSRALQRRARLVGCVRVGAGHQQRLHALGGVRGPEERRRPALREQRACEPRKARKRESSTAAGCSRAHRGGRYGAHYRGRRRRRRRQEARRLPQGCQPMRLRGEASTTCSGGEGGRRRNGCQEVPRSAAAARRGGRLRVHDTRSGRQRLGGGGARLCRPWRPRRPLCPSPPPFAGGQFSGGPFCLSRG